MKVAQFSPASGFQMTDMPIPPLSATDALIRVTACGVCGSDRQVVQGESVPLGTTFPLIMGHEIAGTIEQVGTDVSKWHIGQEVIVHPFLHCGTCAACSNGAYNLCIRQTCIGYQQPGGFAEYVVVPATQLVTSPTTISSAAAALLVDAYATPYHAMRQAGVAAGKTVLIIGTGGLGLAALSLAQTMSVGHLGAVSRRTSGIDLARNHGAEIAVSTGDDERKVARQLRRWAGAGGVDIVIDTVATDETISFATEVVRPGGVVTLVGMSDETAALPVAKTVRRGIQLQTSYGSVKEDVEQLVDWVNSGKLQPDTLIAGTLGLDSVQEAFNSERRPGRWVVTP